MIRPRDLRRAKRGLSPAPVRAVASDGRLTAVQRRAVVEKLRDELDLLCRGDPSAHDIEVALLIAEAAA